MMMIEEVVPFLLFSVEVIKSLSHLSLSHFVTLVMLLMIWMQVNYYIP